MLLREPVVHSGIRLRHWTMSPSDQRNAFAPRALALAECLSMIDKPLNTPTSRPPYSDYDRRYRLKSLSVRSNDF